jgi:hypothetical protein
LFLEVKHAEVQTPQTKVLPMRQKRRIKINNTYSKTFGLALVVLILMELRIQRGDSVPLLIINWRDEVA